MASKKCRINMTIRIDGELEIDQERGVIYFHSAMTGTTVLRICQLPKPIPDPRWIIRNGAIQQTGRMLDIAHMFGADWGSDIEAYYKARNKKVGAIDGLHKVEA